jgi:hypothetical protein
MVIKLGIQLKVCHPTIILSIKPFNQVNQVVFVFFFKISFKSKCKGLESMNNMNIIMNQNSMDRNHEHHYDHKDKSNTHHGFAHNDHEHHKNNHDRECDKSHKHHKTYHAQE